MDDGLGFHIASRAAALVAAGMARAAATEQAIREFGDVTAAKGATRPAIR